MIVADLALLPGGWARDVRVTLRGDRIAAVEEGARPRPDDARVGALLPAPSNLHSHGFQRAMAGMTERRSAGRDSFWTWRETMYRFTARLSPDQVEAIAALAFMEMQEAGFAAVAEFHYLHHAPGGAPYDDPAELSARICAAAARTGIGLTLLPVLYARGGAGGRPLAPAQRRFGTGPDAYARLLEGARAAARGLPADTVVGIAPHSLRAVTPDDLARALPLAAGGPVHIHVAEQPREVDEIRAALGARPVEWLLANAPVDAGWCAVHATHMTADERRGLASTGAVAGLCPVTEANLGDGPFDGPGWRAAGGAFGLGSDSNVRISLVEEMRTLEYGQRLRDLSRCAMAGDDGSTGEAIFLGAAAGGARALGRPAGRIAPGLLADLMAIDLGHPALCALGSGQILDGLAFAAPDAVVTDVWSAGRHRVRGGRHVAREAIVTAWRRVAAELAADA
mgnify:CR=1 FL=1